MTKNLFTNGDFKDGLRAWSLYTVSTLDSNNWPTGTLSAGAAGFSLALSTSSEALEGRVSGKLTKSSASAQRQGLLSEVLQVDKELQGNVVRFKFSYNLSVTSGSIALTNVVGTHDIKIALWDGSSWIQPSGHLSINTSGAKAVADGEFQMPINTTQIQLFIFQATTGAALYDLFVDSFELGRTAKVYGAVITDWQSFTPTGSLTTNVTYSGRWRRVGDTLEAESLISFTGANIQGAVTINLPNGLTIDTTKLVTTADKDSLGLAVVRDEGTDSFTGFVRLNTSTSVIPTIQAVGATWAGRRIIDTSANTPQVFASSDAIYAKYSVPIVGWSGSNILSSDADTRVVAAALRKTGSQAVGPGNTKVTLGNVEISTHGQADASSSRINILLPGIYEISGRAGYNTASNTDGNHYFIIYKNGSASNIQSNVSQTAAGGGYDELNGSGLLDLKAGDYIEMYVSSDANSYTISSGYLYVVKLSGPATVASSETVAARYTTAAGQILEVVGSGEVINFDTKDYDTHGAVTTGASWKFTAPIAGFYRIKASIESSSVSWTAGNALVLYFRKNGSNYSVHEIFIEATTTRLQMIIGGTTCFLNAGEYIDVLVDHDRSGGDFSLRTLGLTNFVEIERIGR